MRDFPFPVYLRAHRKRWALSQPELARLLGLLSGTTVSRYELNARSPTVDALIGCEFVFGEPGRKLFPALYASVEREIVARTALLAELIGERADTESLVKRELLEAIAARVASNRSHV